MNCEGFFFSGIFLRMAALACCALKAGSDWSFEHLFQCCESPWGFLNFFWQLEHITIRKARKKKCIPKMRWQRAESADVKLRHGLGQVGADWWNSHVSRVMIKNQFYRPLLPFLFSYCPFFSLIALSFFYTFTTMPCDSSSDSQSDSNTDTGTCKRSWKHKKTCSAKRRRRE